MAEFKDFTAGPISDIGAAPAAPAAAPAQLTRADAIRIAKEEGADPALVLAHYAQESSGGTNAKTSIDGAVGGMQVLPKTFKGMYPDGDINNPEHNMRAGVRYIKRNLERFKSPEAAIAAYFTGEGNVARNNGDINAMAHLKDSNGVTVPQYVFGKDGKGGVMSKYNEFKKLLGGTEAEGQGGAKSNASRFTDFVADTPEQPATGDVAPEGGVTAGDFGKTLTAGALAGAGMIAQGGGELVARGVNAVGKRFGADPQLRAINPLQGAIDYLNESRSKAAKGEIANSQISGEVLKPDTWEWGKDPSVSGIALQGMDAIGQFMPNFGIALVTAGASVPLQLGIGATVGGIQALGGASGEERSKFQAMSHEQLTAASGLYRELIGKGVDQNTAKNAVAEAAALGGGLGNAIPSAAEGAFENFLIGALTKGKLRIPSLGKGMAGRVAVGGGGGALMGGSEEALETASQNLGSNMAVEGNRPLGADTLAQFVMGMLAEGTVGTGMAMLPAGDDAQPAAPGVPVEGDKPQPPGAPPPPAAAPTEPAGPQGGAPTQGAEPTLPAPPTTAADVDNAAQFTDPKPTAAEKKSGRYNMGTVDIHGMTVDIETAKGAVRSGKDEDGKAWSNTLKHHYGKIAGAKAADGDELDTTVGPNPESTMAYVVNQNNPKTGEFDEHKVQLGFNSEEEAKAGYLSNYDKDWKGFGSIVAIPVDELKTRAEAGEFAKKQAFAGAEANGSAAAAEQPAIPAEPQGGAIQNAQGDAQEPGSTAAPAAGVPTTKHPLTAYQVPNDLNVTLPVTVEETGEVHDVEMNALETFKESSRKMNRLKALLDCMQA